MSCRSALQQRYLRLRQRGSAVRRWLSRIRHLRGPHFEQRQLRCVRCRVQSQRATLLTRKLRYSVPCADDRLRRSGWRRIRRHGGSIRVRGPREQQGQLRILRGNLRGQPHVRQRGLRVQRAVRRLRRHLHEPRVRRQQLRHVRHDLRERRDLQERNLSVTL
jgi:hypothetical protein